MADPLKQWADSKLGKGGCPPAPGAKAPPPPMVPKTAASAGPPVAVPPKIPDVRADQMTWLGEVERQELKGHEPDPPPSWIDPMAWEQAKVQMGNEWNGLPEPRAAAAFMVHQAQQSAKAAAMPPPGAPAAPGAPPPVQPPPSPKPAFGGPLKPFGGK